MSIHYSVLLKLIQKVLNANCKKKKRILIKKASLFSIAFPSSSSKIKPHLLHPFLSPRAGKSILWEAQHKARECPAHHRACASVCSW